MKLLPVCNESSLSTELAPGDRYALLSQEHIHSHYWAEWHTSIKELPRCHPTKGPWIAGGSPRRFLLVDDSKTGDVDYFCKDQQQHHLLCSRLESMDAVFVNQNQYQHTYTFGNLTLQVIKARYRLTLEKHLDEFDFNLCQTGWDGEKFWVSVDAWKDLLLKQINCTGVFHNPIGSLVRLAKYHKQGFVPGPTVLNDILSEYSGHELEETYGENK